MLNKKIEELINLQIEREGYSSQLYLAMASWAEVQGYEGITQWLYAQADEERLHKLKMISYVNERGGVAVIPEIKKPPMTYENVLSVFKQVLEHEEFITASINEIVKVCTEEKDFTTLNWLQWFVNEQIQEEKSAQQIIGKLKMAGEHNLYFFDRDIMSLRGAAEAPAT